MGGKPLHLAILAQGPTARCTFFFLKMRIFAHHGLAPRFGWLWVLGCLPGLFWGPGRPLGRFRSGGGGPEGRLPFAGSTAIDGDPGSHRGHGDGKWRPSQPCPSGATGASLQIGEEKTTCGLWFGSEPLDGSGSMGHQFDYNANGDSGGHLGPGEGGRTKNEVCKHPGSGRRFRICGGERIPKAGMVADLCQPDRRLADGAGRSHHRATVGPAQEAHDEAMPLCRLRGVPAIWKESASSAALQDLCHDTEWLLHEGTSRSKRNRPVESIFPGVPHCSPDVERGDDGNGGSLRVLYREAGQALQGVLALGSPSRRAGPFRAHAETEGGSGDGHRVGGEGTCYVEPRQSLGGAVQETSQGLRLLGRTSASPCKRLACPRLEGKTTHALRSHCREQHPGWSSRTEGRDGGPERSSRAVEEVGKRTPSRSQEKEVSGNGGQGQRHEGKGQGQRQRQTSSLLCLEQQQWGLCWTPSRIRLPRKGRKRTPMHGLWISWTPLAPMRPEGKLIEELKKDWARRDKNDKAKVHDIPIMVWGRSRSRRRSDGKDQTNQDGDERRGGGRKRRRSKGREDKTDDEPKAEFNGKLMTLEVYTMKRRFNFLHMYAGVRDPLCKAIDEEAKRHRMKVSLFSAEKENGVDLLEEEPYLDFLKKAKEGFWDGMHSGFPCTSFSRLRWREAEGYPGPVRSKSHPYGLPGLSTYRQAEADEGTLHASRSVHMADKIISSRPEDKLRPFATLENPPPTDHAEHLSAWELPEVADLFEKYQKENFQLASFPTCAYQPHLDFGLRIYKPQMFGGTLPGISSLRSRCVCGDAGHIPVVGKERSAASGEYPEDLCKQYARLVIRQFQRMAKAEFYTKRQEDLRKEVDDLKRRSQKHQRRDPSSTRGASSEKKEETDVKDEEEVVKATASSKAKGKAKAKQEKDEYEYTYEYESSESSDEQAQKDAKKDKEDETDDQDVTKDDKAWKGGEGKFEMMRNSKAKRDDPRNLNFVGGMRNPAEVVEGMPNALTLGLRVFAAWERFLKSNKAAMETAANYGTDSCHLDGRTLERWGAELRKVVGARGKMRAQLKSKWVYTSPIQSDIVSAWTSKAADADVEVARWIDEGTPLGINLDIKSRGIFPPSDKESEQESMVDAAMQMARGSLVNYASVRENVEDTKVEVERLEKLGFLKRLDEKTVMEEFSQGTISRLAIIVKERPDKTKKRRLIIDLRRSGGNSKARLEERLVLPRALDAVGMMRTMAKMKEGPNIAEQRELWKRELVLIDISDAFPHLAVHHQELEHCLTPGLQEGEFFLFRALLFGYKTAPLLWSRVAAWLGRLLQACVPLHEGRHQIYLDDSLWLIQGTLQRRNEVLAFILYTMGALGFNLSINKGERGARVTWSGVEFHLGDNHVLLTLPEKFINDLQERVGAWEAKGMAPLKDLRAICGKLSWLSGVLPRTRWMLRVFYAVLAQREAEVRGGLEEARRQTRTDSRNKEHLFVVKRLEGARQALLEYLNVTKERPTRKISLSPRDKARVTITTDASPEGLGAILIINSQVIDALASPVTELDAKDLEFELGASSSQGTVEALALVVALQHWCNKLAGMSIELTVQADSVTALAMAQKQSAASPSLNFLGAILGILLEKAKVEDMRLVHIPGVANKAADYLSRPSKWKGTPRPTELGDVKITEAGPRSEGFYQLAPPGRKPDLWGASDGEEGLGPWHSLFK